MTWNEETRILRADEGKWVTEDDINFAIEVKLAPSEDIANWWKVDHIPEPPFPPIEPNADEYANTEPEE